MRRMSKACAPRRYFLGVNSGEGFTSFYHEFPPENERSFLWYIKGGPGNGKSTLMRALAQAAEEKGLGVEYAFCSGDPDSLDGIYIRESGLGYVDATSPHVQEPGAPGADGRYLDLSECYTPGLEKRRTEIRSYFRRYRERYQRSYALLGAAARVSPEGIPGLVRPEDRAAAEETAAEAAAALEPEKEGYRCCHRFLSAYCCRGRVSFWDRVEAERCFALDDSLGLADAFLRKLHCLCREKGCSVILCPDPLRPERLEGLILPGQSLAFAAGPQGTSPFPKVEKILLGKGAGGPDKDLREEVQRCQAMRSTLLREATESLREAKRLHDALEALYHPYVDFSAVDRVIREQIERL